jgi:hypothetical protein
MKWIIIDGKGKRRLAKPNEILSQPIIDDSEVGLEDGDLILTNKGVTSHGGNEGEHKKRTKNSKI